MKEWKCTKRVGDRARPCGHPGKFLLHYVRHGRDMVTPLCGVHARWAKHHKLIGYLTPLPKEP